MIDFFSNINRFVPQFIRAFFVTLQLASVSLVIATLLGIIVGVSMMIYLIDILNNIHYY